MQSSLPNTAWSLEVSPWACHYSKKKKKEREREIKRFTAAKCKASLQGNDTGTTTHRHSKVRNLHSEHFCKICLLTQVQRLISGNERITRMASLVQILPKFWRPKNMQLHLMKVCTWLANLQTEPKLLSLIFLKQTYWNLILISKDLSFTKKGCFLKVILTLTHRWKSCTSPSVTRTWQSLLRKRYCLSLNSAVTDFLRK